MLYLPLHKEFLPLQTSENVKATQQGEVGHVFYSLNKLQSVR
jgi:hypothetical protein